MNPVSTSRLSIVIAVFLVGFAAAGQLAVAQRVRIATYNVSLYGKVAGQVHHRLSDGRDAQAEKIAAIVQTVRPDILLVNEIDFDASGATAQLLAQRFFAQPQGERRGIDYPHVYAIPANTGVPSGMDLDRNGNLGDAADAWGYGVYPGQFAMAIYSRFPIDEPAIRTFKNFRWADMPDALRPQDPKSREYFYDDATWSALRLSSKNHIDIPIVAYDHCIHVLASHPTPPVFDGAENRNGCRNHDEIRFWNDYLSGVEASAYIVDDFGRPGGIDPGASVAVMGDLNADPTDGDGIQSAIQALLTHQRLHDPKPKRNHVPAQRGDGQGEPATDTARFRQRTTRVDYVLPSRDLDVVDSGVFWPPPDHEDFLLVNASDHRMVWIEVELP